MFKSPSLDGLALSNHKASFKCELLGIIITTRYIWNVLFMGYMFSLCITTRLLLQSFEKVVLGSADMIAFYIFVKQ